MLIKPLAQYRPVSKWSKHKSAWIPVSCLSHITPQHAEQFSQDRNAQIEVQLQNRVGGWGD